MTAATKSHKRAAHRASYTASRNAAELPKKKLYRQRAHANPFSDHALTYPVSPSQMDWSPHYPAYVSTARSDTQPPQLTQPVTVADIGCGFGGLLVALSPLLPDELVLGLEIRVQVTRFVHDRIHALRQQQASVPVDTSSAVAAPPDKKTSYQNISALRTNSMKFLPNFFPRASLAHLFLCFPDPHFKARKHKARIVSDTLCAEYAYVLQPGGLIWTITDVEELARWMAERFARFGRSSSSASLSLSHPPSQGQVGAREKEEEQEEGHFGLFAPVSIPPEGQEADWPDTQIGQLTRCIREETEEGKKVSRNGGRKFVAVWRRGEDPDWPT